MKRRSRSEIVELVKASMPWRSISEHLLSPEDAAVFKHRKQALEMYMKGCTIADIKHQTTVDGSYLKKMIKRCLTIAPDGFVYGYSALLPNMAIKVYTRTKVVDPSRWQSGAGFAGLLGATFKRYPELESRLKTLILRKKPKPKPKSDGMSNVKHAFSNRASDIHSEFIAILKEKEHPKTEWPFNTKYHGIKPLTKFFNKVREEHYEHAVQLTGDSGAIAHIPVGTGHRSLIRSRGLMESIEIDSHTLDSMFVLILEHEHGLETYHVRKRLHILVAVESLTGVVLWYYVVHGDDVSAEDVLMLLRQMLSAQLPKPEFTIKDLELSEGAGYPSQLLPEMVQILPLFIKLDNALAHLGHKVSSDLRKQTGCILDFGVPGRPERRPKIEHTFKRIAKDLIQRFPSTTGSGPDEGRAKDPELAACKFRIASDDLDQLVYAYYANFNAEPSEGLRFLSPLEAVSQLIKKDHYLPRLPPHDLRETLGVVTVTIPREVKGGVRDGHRPYVTIHKARYTSHRLIDSPELIGKRLIIEVQESDLRVVNAYLENGSPIGPLTVQGDWAEMSHSLRTRKEINSLIARKIIFRVKGVCIVTVYTRYLEAKLNAAAERKKQDKNSAAKLGRVKSEQSQSSLENELVAEGEVKEFPISSPSVAATSIPKREYLVALSDLDLLDLVKNL
ncbi:hypothetical protein [Pseudomonas sp. JY-Q]|uniref:hypothetical protein n=1 Tax=Pseudomonas sp. JY-Q TaxID=1338689 RepID=UPI000AA583AE|nr:hypothetical protein [Pseudomonas sp. JY-Q]